MKQTVSIFFDTNIAQSYIEKNVYLSKIGIPAQYYELVSFLTDNRLEEYVEICFPEVVIREMKAHMKECFHSCSTKFIESICDYKELYGDLLSIELQIKVPADEYPKYVDNLFEEFLNNPRNRCKAVPYPSDEGLVDILLTKAINGIRPFFVGGINGKKHSDAGFKDSLIAETIYDYCKKNGTIGMLLSGDGDFGTAFEKRLHEGSSFVLVHSIDEAIKALANYFGTDPKDFLTREFTENRYWHERLLEDAGVVMDTSVSECIVERVSEIDDGIYNIAISFTVNETRYIFSVKFDKVGNDIIECTYHIEND